MKLSRRSLLAGAASLALAAVGGLGLAIAGGGNAADPAAEAADPSRTTPNGCCCVVQDDKLVCRITGEVLEKCCCR